VGAGTPSSQDRVAQRRVSLVDGSVGTRAVVSKGPRRGRRRPPRTTRAARCDVASHSHGDLLALVSAGVALLERRRASPRPTDPHDTHAIRLSRRLLQSMPGEVTPQLLLLVRRSRHHRDLDASSAPTCRGRRATWADRRGGWMHRRGVRCARAREPPAGDGVAAARSSQIRSGRPACSGWVGVESATLSAGKGRTRWTGGRGRGVPTASPTALGTRCRRIAACADAARRVIDRAARSAGSTAGVVAPELGSADACDRPRLR